MLDPRRHSDEPRLTVACVLRSGGDFNAAWVQRLARGVAEHLTVPHRCVCLSDCDIPGVVRVPIDNDWPKWWPKISLFRPGLFDGLVVYLDLDTLVLDSLDEFATFTGSVALLSDFYSPQLAASGVMLWRPSSDTEQVYREFLKDPKGIMRRNRTRMDRWLRLLLPNAERVQDLYPGKVVSFKAHAKKRKPDGAALCCGHGPPRFSDPAAGWAHEVWKAA